MSFGFGKITLYELNVFLLAFCQGLSMLFFVNDTELLSMAVDFITVAADVLLVIVVIQKLKEYDHIVALLLLGFLGIVSFYFTASILMIKAMLLVIGAKGESITRVFRALWLAFLISIILGLMTDIAGLGSSEQFRRNGWGIGFEHPNQAALLASVSIMLICVANSMETGKPIGSPAIFAVILSLLLLIWATGSRTSLLVLAVFIGCYYLYRRAVNNGSDRIPILLSLCAPALLIFSLVTAHLLFHSGFVQWLDTLFSTRIWLNWFAINNFDITLFGQTAELQVSGVHNTLRDTWNVTTTIDCTYISGLLRFGIIGIIIWTYASYITPRNAWKSAPMLASASIALSVYAFTESQLMDPLLSFPLLTMLGLNRKKSSAFFNMSKRLESKRLETSFPNRNIERLVN